MTAPGGPRHRFKPPWRAVRTTGGYMVVDVTERPLCYLYSDEGPQDANCDKPVGEVRRLAAGFARLPKLLGVSPAAARSPPAPNPPTRTD